MPKSLSLFGRYVRQQGKYCRATFRKYQVTKLIPNNAAGRTPSASSQRALWHNDDFNSFWRVSAYNTIFRKRTKPAAVMRDLDSVRMAQEIRNVRVTPSALYAIDDKGSFDNYILRTPPEELRSNYGEKMREVMKYLEDNREVQAWRLPWKTFLRKRDMADPWYARYRHGLASAKSNHSSSMSHTRFSPYFLPATTDGLYPQRDAFVSGREAPSLNLWWMQDKKVEEAFRKRLGDAKSFDEAFPDHREAGSYRKGQGAGGGGGQGSPRPRSKVYRSRKSRPY